LGIKWGGTADHDRACQLAVLLQLLWRTFTERLGRGSCVCHTFPSHGRPIRISGAAYMKENSPAVEAERYWLMKGRLSTATFAEPSRVSKTFDVLKSLHPHALGGASAPEYLF